VGKRVVTDYVAFRFDPAEYFGMALRTFPDNEKRGRHVLALQQIEQARREPRVRAVVERQANLVVFRGTAHQEPSTRQRSRQRAADPLAKTRRGVR
jgi:hypothetical protein